MSTFVPATIHEVTPSWLAAVVRPLMGGDGPVSTDVTRIGAEFGFSSEIFRVALGPESPVSVVVKLWSTDGTAGTREVLFYNSFGADAGIRLPRCYHAAVDTMRRRGVLVLADIRGGGQGDCLNLIPVQQAMQLARDLARFHCRWLSSPRVLDATWIPSIREQWRDAAWFELRRALFIERLADRLVPKCRLMFESITAVQRQANTLLSDLPETMLHHDLHLDNLIFEADGRAVFLDWTRVARGPAALDLCDVLLMVRPEQAQGIIDTYTIAVRGHGATINDGELTRGVTGAMLRKFIAWTYGAARWEPKSIRGQRILHEYISRVQDAVLARQNEDPEGFMFLDSQAI